MIKKLQALKAKKGFTLVELVVVIAIIGVLAAILVPTMLGVVQDSRITSANSSAQQVKDRVTEFFTKMDAAKASYKGTGHKIVITITGGNWVLGAASGTSTTAAAGGSGTGDAASTFSTTYADTDWLDGGDHWGESVNTANDITDKDTKLLNYLADSLSDLKNAYIEVWVKSGKVLGVSCVDGATSSIDNLPGAGDFQAGKYGFNGSTKAGVMDNVVIGTSPTLALDTASTTTTAAAAG